MIFFKLLKIKKRTYLDYASSTPIDTKMLKMVPFLNKMSLFANPSALHKEGLFARGIINQSRERIAKILDIQNDEILFTSSATESNNLAINGLIKNFLARKYFKGCPKKYTLNQPAIGRLSLPFLICCFSLF